MCILFSRSLLSYVTASPLIFTPLSFIYVPLHLSPRLSLSLSLFLYMPFTHLHASSRTSFDRPVSRSDIDTALQSNIAYAWPCTIPCSSQLVSDPGGLPAPIRYPWERCVESSAHSFPDLVAACVSGASSSISWEAPPVMLTSPSCTRPRPKAP